MQLQNLWIERSQIKLNNCVFTILIPCLNESETLEKVIKKSLNSIEKSGLAGEVLVSDNGSTDGSQLIATLNGARVIDVSTKGYGSALKAGIESAKGEFVIMGDADDSYALDEISLFIEKLQEGFDLVIGNRFKGGIEKDAMPWLHKYLGNPVLSWLGRVFFKIPIYDFHCGLRGFRKEAIQKLNLQTTGMEFASEMVVKASLNNLRITEVPTTLKKDGRSRPPHLRTWRDGWRHLIFLLAASPKWLFLFPGLLLSLFGTMGMILTAQGEFRILGLSFELNTYFVSMGILLVGIQTILTALLARIFASNHGFLPKTKNISRFEKYFSLEKGILVALLLILISLLWLITLLANWNGNGFSTFDLSTSLRVTGILILTLTSGIQILFASFFASLMQV